MSECSKGHEQKCANARTPKCTCRCGGANHGARMRDYEPDESFPLSDPRIFDGPLDMTFRKLAPGAEFDVRLWRDRDGNALANIPQSLVYHSPTGFEWSYAGSGPADLALNILHLVVRPPEAWKMHQDFKCEFLVNMPKAGGTIKMRDVKGWIMQQWRERQTQAQLNLSGDDLTHNPQPQPGSEFVPTRMSCEE